MAATEKLQKVIAAHGYTSRRKAEDLIRDGKVSVNGRIASIGARVASHDLIRVNGYLINAQPRRAGTRVLLYHKPEGEVCSRLGDGKKTVFDALPPIRQGRWIGVGRLDLNSSGLLLFTNDGDLANFLMHPRQCLQRVYLVRVMGELSGQQMQMLKQGVDLADGIAAFTDIREKSATDRGEHGGRNHWYEVSLEEGRNREVRRMFEALNMPVSRLVRVAYGPFQLDKTLKKGKYMELKREQLKDFLERIQYKAC